MKNHWRQWFTCKKTIEKPLSPIVHMKKPLKNHQHQWFTCKKKPLKNHQLQWYFDKNHYHSIVVKILPSLRSTVELVRRSSTNPPHWVFKLNFVRVQVIMSIFHPCSRFFIGETSAPQKMTVCNRMYCYLDMIFVKNFKPPGFQAYNFTPQKCVVCNIFSRELTA